MKSLLSEIAIIVLLFCGTLSAQEVTRMEKCSNKFINVTQVEQPDGWPIKFVNQSKVLGRKKFTLAETDGSELVSVSYDVKKMVIVIPQIQIDQCDQSAVLSNWYVIPESVVAFQSKGRTFAYALSGRLVSGPQLDSSAVGGKMDFRFYDTNGEGKFTRLQLASGVGPPPNIPAWLR